MKKQIFITIFNHKKSSLLNNLMGYWNFENNWMDLSGNNNNLIPAPTSQAPSFSVGKVGSAASFLSSSSQYASINSNPTLTTGDISFTVCAWVKLSSKTGIETIISKDDFSTTTREWALLYNNTSDRFQFLISSNGSSAALSVNADNLGSPAIGLWYFIIAFHDSVNDLIGIQVNNDVSNIVSTLGVYPSQRNGSFTVGNEKGLFRYWDGLIDEVGFWKKILDQKEKDTLYRGGSGNIFPFDLNSSFILLTSPVSYQVFQRNDSNVSDININGVYMGSPTAIEASFNGGPWTEISSNPKNGVFSGKLSNQLASQGNLSVRFTNAPYINTTSNYVGIGDVYLVAGQSNAEGNLTNKQSYTHNNLKASMYRENGKWSELIDPTDSNAVGTGNSIWPLLATKIMNDQDVPVSFITSAEDGTGLGDNDPDWQKGNATYNKCLSQIISSKVNNIKAILWYQGEHEPSQNTTQSNYQTALSQMLNDLQTDTGFLNMKLVCGQTGQAGVSNRNLIDGIRLAQQNRWLNDPDIYPGPLTYDLNLSDNGGDGVHIKTDAHAIIFSNRFWRSLYKEFYNGNESSRGPQIQTATINNNIVTVTFTGGEGGLKNQTNKTGWRFTDNGFPITIISCEANGLNGVTIILASIPIGEKHISFGSGQDAIGATLSDNGTYSEPPEPFVNYFIP